MLADTCYATNPRPGFLLGGATSGPPLGPLGPLAPLGALGSPQGHPPMPVRSSSSTTTNNNNNNNLPPLGRPTLARQNTAPEPQGHGPAPPSASRQPPDGDEFPPRYHDPLLLGPTGHPALDAATPVKLPLVPPLPLSSPPCQLGPTAAPDSRGWRKDERSERSVRDKIAMFTQSTCGAPVTRLASLSNKFRSSEDVFLDTVDGAVDTKLRSRSVVSVDRVGKTTSPTGDASSTSSTSSSAYSSFCSPESSLSPTLNESTTMPRKAVPVLARATSFSGPLGHQGNQGNQGHQGHQGNPRTGVAAQGVQAPGVDEARRASLIALVEQRRRSISKLRGLVIPDKVPDQGTSIVDLPEIRSKDIAVVVSQPQHPTTVLTAAVSTSPVVHVAPTPVLTSPPWKSQGASNLPKYSPAFKRKSLTLRATSTTTSLSRVNQDLLIGEPTRTSRTSSAFLSDSGRSAEEESDNDSAVSSSRSSISHGFSPPASPLLPTMAASSNGRSSSTGSFLRRTLSSDTTVSASASSNAAYGTSQASISSSSSSSSSSNCSLDNNRRVLKAQSVDAINRKNVLFSARCRSGRNLRSGSPLMQHSNEGSNEDGDEDEEDEEGSNDDEEEEEEDGEVEEEVAMPKMAKSNCQVRRDPREEIKELERMVSMADTDVESNEALSCDDSVNSSDDALEPRMRGSSSSGRHGCAARHNRVHYRPATLRDLRDLRDVPDQDVKVAFLNGIELDLHPVCDDARTQLTRPPAILPKPLSRNGSVDGLLNGSGALDGGATPPESAAPRIRSLKKRNASDPLFLERNTLGNATTATTLHAVSVNDIRKAFEKAELALSPTSPSPPNGISPTGSNGRLVFGGFGGFGDRLNGSTSSGSGSGSSTGGSGTLIPSHARGSSIDSTTSEDGFPGHLSKEQFGSITSLASTTSLISQQELQQLIDDANQTLEEASSNGSSLPGSCHEVLVVILHRETAGASVGITLAGGADYETKEITVHKVLSGSPAERDGRLQKGDRILSINGRNMKGVTHRESLAILKAPRPEVVLVVSRSRGDVGRTYEEPVNNSSRVSSRPPRILEQPIIDHNDAAVPRGPPVNVVLQKDGAGLGFSLEGGKDSPLGDRPLTIKKIFTGGCAEKSGFLQAGDELLSVNNADVTRMSRIEAWGLMKRLPNGSVTLSVRHVCVNAAEN